MKCICGYERENDFDLICYKKVSPDGRYVQRICYEGLYACPKCGTIKIKTKEDIHD